MSSVKQYIKNPKFGQGDEPEFLPVGTTGIDAVKNRLLQVERQALNITIRDKKNYASLAEAIAAVTYDKYKFKGFILTYNTGTDWVSKRYNSDDAGGFANEGNWIDAGGAAGGTQYLDLSMFSSDSGTLSEEDYQKVVKAYEDKTNVAFLETSIYPLAIQKSDNVYMLSISFANDDEMGHNFLTLLSILVVDNSYTKTSSILSVIINGSGTKALTDNGQYAEFASPIKTQDGGTGAVTKELQPNTFYKFGECSSLTITLAAGKSGILNEYMFEFISGSTPTTLTDIPNIKWQNGDKLVTEANCTYRVSIVNNCAVYAKFPNA